MEGDGEGLVAIVQGLNTAGVTLTVLNRRSDNTERRRSPKPRQIEIDGKPITDQKSSVETSTELANTTTTGVQICDGRYASSYRLAHCRMVPTSPPDGVSEFPPQRKEPSRNLGNFEVGGHGSEQIKATSARSKHYGGSHTGGDREPVRSKSSRATDAFAHSLRKYPSLSPLSTVSTDLIERLIRCTQAKNSPKPSRTTKSMRSLHKDRSDTNNITKVSKHQQTYIRTPQNNNDNGISNIQLGYRGRTTNFKLYSPMSDSRNIKYRESPFSSSYDYLKASSSRRVDWATRPDYSNRSDRSGRLDRSSRSDRTGRPDRSNRDMRLTDVSRYIRNTIRQIYNERPVVFQVCPKLKNRYNQHKKNHCTVKNTDSMINDSEDQASVPTLTRILASLSGSCGMPCTISRSESPQSLQSPENSDIYCYCNKAAQCSCNPDASTSTSLIDSKILQLSKSISCRCCLKSTDKSSQGVPKCECVSVTTEPICRCSNDDIAYYNKRIDQEICNWLIEVPVHTVECLENKNKRENMLIELGQKLKDLPDDEEFDENAKNEIDNFMKDFPMWYPGNKKTEEQFKQQLADKLLEEILDIPRKPDRFRDAVKNWVKDLNFVTEDKDVDTDAIVDDFVSKLKALAANRPACNGKYKDILKTEIFEMLEELPLKILGNKEVILNKISNKLAGDIVRIPAGVDLTEDRASLIDEFEEDISDWLNEIDEFGDNVDKLKADQKLIRRLAKKLDRFQSQGVDDEVVEEKIKDEIYKFLADVDVSPDRLDELINDLVEKLTDSVQTKKVENFDHDELSDEIIDWLQNIPKKTIQVIHPQKIRKTAEELSSKIKEAKQQGNEDYQNDIIECLANTDLHIDPVVLRDQIEVLMEILQNWPSKKKYKENAREKILKEIDNVIDVSLISKDKKKDLKNKLADMVSKHFDNSLLDSESDQDDVKEALLEGIDNIIDQIQMPKDRKSDLKIKVGSALIKQFDKSLSVLSEDGDNIKQTVAKTVRNVVKKFPISKDQKKDIMQQVKQTLPKKIHKPLPDDFRDAINEGISNIIDESLISEEKQISSNIKNRLLIAAANIMDSLPTQSKNIGDIQDRVAKDVNNDIDDFLIDIDKKRTLKQNIQDILTENTDEPLSDEVKETIKAEIMNLIDDLSIPIDKKNNLKNKVGFTVTKGFDRALSSLRQDISKLKMKMIKGVNDAIEKSPLERNEKHDLKNKFKSMLSLKLDSSHTDEEKQTIIDDISKIVNEKSIPEDKRSDLKNKLTSTLAKKLGLLPTSTERKYTKDLRDQIKKEITDIIDEASISEDQKNNIKKIVNHRLNMNVGASLPIIKDLKKQEIYDVIDNASITSEKKKYFKSEFANIFAKYFDELPTERLGIADYEKSVTKEINSVIDKLTAVDSREKKELKEQVKEILADNLYQPLSDEVKESIMDDILDILDDVSISTDKKSDINSKLAIILENNIKELLGQGKDKDYIKKAIAKDISRIIDELSISRAEKNNLKEKVKGALVKNIDRILSDKIKETIKGELNNVVDDLSIHEDKKIKLKDTFANIIDNKNFDVLPTQRWDRGDIKNVLSKEIENIIDNSSIDPEKKKDLKKNVKLGLVETLYEDLSDEVKTRINNDISDIINAINMSEEEKTDLKLKIANTLTEDFEGLLAEEKDVGYIINATAKNISKIIDGSQIPKDKMEYLKRKVENALNVNLVRPLSDDLKETIVQKLSNIIDDSIISKDIKSDLKKQIRAVVGIKIDDLLTRAQRDDIDDEEYTKHLEELETSTKNKILQGIEKLIDESPISKEEKIELKKKLKEMATENFKNQLSGDAQDALKDGINSILDELPLSKDKKNKLKNDITDMVDENITTMRDDIQESKNLQIQKQSVAASKAKGPKDTGLSPRKEAKESEVKNSILQGIENAIDEAPISKEKKMELKKKLKKMAAENFNQPLSGDVQDLLKDGISSIIDELPVSKDKKNKLINQLNDMVDENIQSLRDEESSTKDEITDMVDESIATMSDDIKNSKGQKVTSSSLNKKAKESEVKDSILQGIENAIDEAPISKEKKMELKKKLKKMAAEHFNQPLSGDVQDLLKDGISSIIDELPVPKDKKNILINQLNDMVDKNIQSLRDEESSPENEITDMVDESIATMSNDIKEAKRQKDTNLSPKKEEKEAKESKVKNSILQGIENTIDEAPISEEKKMELKNKLKKLAAENFTQPLSGDVQDLLKDGISSIIDELPVPKDKKNKLINQLNDMVDKNIQSLRDEESSPEDEITDIVDENVTTMGDDVEEKEDKETEVTDSILQGIENTTKDVPKDKQNKLNKQFNNVVDKKIQSLRDEESSPDNEIKDMVDENIATMSEDIEESKNFQKRNVSPTKVTAQKETSLSPKKEGKESKVKDSILQGIENTIDEAPISEEKKMLLKNKIKKMTTDTFNQPLSDDVQDLLKDGISSILDELPIPTEKKNKLINQLNDVVDENIKSFRDEESSPEKEITDMVDKNLATMSDDIKESKDLQILHASASKAKRPKDKSLEVTDSILQEIETTIDEAPKEKKNRLNKQFNDMVDKNLQSLRDEESSLENEITDMVDENTMSDDIKKNKGQKNRSLSPKKEAKELEVMDSILQGIENTIDEAPISKEKKMELKKKLKKMAAKNFNQPLSGDVQDLLKDGISSIIDELPVSKDKKNKLINQLNDVVDENIQLLHDEESSSDNEITDMVDESIANMRDDIKESKNIQIQKQSVAVSKARVPKDISSSPKKEVKVVTDSILKGIQNTIDEVPKEKKYKLNIQFDDMVDKNIQSLRDGESSPENEITDMVDQSIATMSEDIKEAKRQKNASLSPKKESKESWVKDSILQGIENTIDEAPISKEKKMELKKKLKKMAAENFNQPLSGDVQDLLKDGISSIIDELPVSKDKKNKLINQLNDVVDENIQSLRDEKSSPENEKTDMVDKNTMSDDTKENTNLQIQKRSVAASKAKGQNDISLSPENVAKESEVKDSILQGIENTINEAPISKEKKMELKKRLKMMAAENFNQPLSGDVQDLLKDGISSIIDELPVSKDKKNKLINQLNDVVDENIQSLRDEKSSPENEKTDMVDKNTMSDDTKENTNLQIQKRSVAASKAKGQNDISLSPENIAKESEVKDSILQGIENTINEAPISKEKKMELKKRLKMMAAENFNQPLSGDVQDLLKDGISSIIDELPVSKDKKNKLINQLNDMVDENIQSLRDEKSSPENEKKDVIDKNIATMSDDMKESKNLQIQKRSVTVSKPRELKDKSLSPIKESKESEVKNSILQGIKNTIDEAPISKEKKIEFERKLKKMVAENFNQTLPGDIQDFFKYGISSILYELPIPKDKKNKLINQLNDVVDENVQSLRDYEVSPENKITDMVVESVASLQYNTNKIDTRFKQEKSKNTTDTWVQVKEEKESIISEIEVDESLREEINDVLCELDIATSDLKIIQENVFFELEDLVVSGVDLENVKSNIKQNFINYTNLSAKQAEDLSSKLIGRAREISLVAKVHDSDLYDKTMKTFMDPKKRRLTELSLKEFIESPEMLKIGQGSIYLIDGVQYDTDDENIRDEVLFKNDVTVSEIKRQVQAKMSKASEDKSTLKSQLSSQSDKTLYKSTLTQTKDIEDLKETMIEDSKIITDKTSIPKDKKKMFRFQLTQAFEEISDVPDTSDSTVTSSTLSDAPKSKKDFLPRQASTPKKGQKLRVEEDVQVDIVTSAQKYRDEIEYSIKTWLDKMPTDLDPKLKAVLIKDLACDVLDRQKYLQVNPGAKSSDQDEQANLNYQVFRRFYKVVNAQNLAPLMQGTEELLGKINEIEVPPDLPKLFPSGRKEREYTRRRRKYESKSQGSGIGNDTPSSNEIINNPLREEIAAVLDVYTEKVKDREELEDDIVVALEELATKGGDTGRATKSVRKSILRLTNLNRNQVEDVSNQLVSRAREMSLIAKTNDSNKNHKVRLSRSDGPKRRFTDKSNKELIDAPDKIQIERKSKTEADLLKRISGFTYNADDDDSKDTTSMKIDVIRIPKDQRPMIIKKRLKETLFKNIDKVIVDSPLSRFKKYKLKEKLNNIIEKDLDKSSLAYKQDIENLKQIVIYDVNTALDELPINKDKIEYLKHKLAKVFNSDIHESVIKNVTEAKERLSQDLDDVINALRISLDEKKNLKHRLTNMINGNEIPQTNKEDMIQRSYVSENESYSFCEEESKNFFPKQYSTPKNYMRRFQDSRIPRDKNEGTKITTSQEMRNLKVLLYEKLEDIIDMFNVTGEDMEALEAELTDILDVLSGRGGDTNLIKKCVTKRIRQITNLPEDDAEYLTLKLNGLAKEIAKVKAQDKNKGKSKYQDKLSFYYIETEKDKEMPVTTSQVMRNLKAPLYEKLEDILDTYNVGGEDREALEGELTDALEELAARADETDVIKKGIIKKIRQLTKLTENDAEHLAQKIITLAKEIAEAKARDKNKGKAPEDQENGEEVDLKALVEDILDMYNVISEDREALEGEVTNALEELSERGGDPDTIKKNLIKSILQFTKLTKGEAEQMAQKLIGLPKEIAESKAQDKSKGITLKDQEEGMVQNDLTKYVNDWIETLPITFTSANEKKTFENGKKAFISKLNEIIPQGDVIAVIKEIKKFMLQLPLDSDMKNDNNVLNEKAEQLAASLAFITPKPKGCRYGMSFNGLSDFIGNWVNDIHIQDTTKNEEEIQKMKKDIAYDLIHKIGEMNVDPEIFNDISLYEDILRDELNLLLDDLTITDENLQSKKDDLIQKVKEAHHRAHDEIAGQLYKQNLRQTMTDVLPDLENLPEEQATMEIMKDQLADAFINLHYSGTNEELKSKLKNTIGNEIDKFCKEYLKRHPDATLDNKNIKENLYNALKRVPLPADDSMIYEVEQVRIRDEINDWVRELPLEPQNPAALLARNKSIYVLSRKLFDIEVEKDDIVGIPIMKKEIARFLQKLPLKPGENKNVGEFADKLINKLKTTESSRRFSENSIAQIDPGDKIPRVKAAGQSDKSNDAKARGVKDLGVKDRGARGSVAKGGFIGGGTSAGGTRSGGVMCPYYKLKLEKQKAALQRQAGQKQQYPPCTLTPEDMAHLDRIRQRSCLSPHCISTLLRGKRNVSVGPQPVDAGSQTDLIPESFAPENGRQGSGSRPSRTYPGMPSVQSDYQERRSIAPEEPFQPSPTDSQAEIQPHIVIKQYCWDTPQGENDENDEETESQQLSQQQQQQNYVPQRSPCRRPPVPYPNPKPQYCPHYPQQKPCQMPQDRPDRSSVGSLSSSRPSWSPGPFAPNQQSTPFNSGTYRQNEGRMPKRDGLQDQASPTTSRPYRKERVIELGSLDDLREPRPKNRNENFDWSYAKFPDEDNFWGSPCMRRVILDEGIDEPIMMEREKREERVRCRCKERLVPKFNSSRSRTRHQPSFQTRNEDSSNLKKCSKCCGVHCPYPSYLYFRQ